MAFRKRIVKIHGADVTELEPNWFLYKWRGVNVYGTSDNIHDLVFERLSKSRRMKILKEQNDKGGRKEDK